ncbi:MAG: SDR family oxidoreductase [Acidimicrobiaceae bacterium]|nr:SDR family oxidoreductase [Acidimicrobiaceae bacterium]MDE0319952.1 SDR family oxidoreductase [Acidimicrobiaceae bacterium]MDE0499626.1 SDR family oxidoreductase [Acidimicrobiaceae bacterium]
MDLRLDGKTALVTGGSAGIGKGIAKAFADAGANVMITSRKADKCEAALPDIGGECDYIAAHIGHLDQAERVLGGTIERYGSLDILVNNAATNPWAGPMVDCDVPRLDKTYEVNLRAPLQWTQTAWQMWMSEHGGSVINIASVGGHHTSEALGVYCMFKDALMHMTRQLAAELGPKVRVNCIAPGLIRTDFARVLWDGPRGKMIADQLPMKRLGEPSDIGEAALFLSAAATWLTGHVMDIDGGECVKISGELPLEEG